MKYKSEAEKTRIQNLAAVLRGEAQPHVAVLKPSNEPVTFHGELQATNSDMEHESAPSTFPKLGRVLREMYLSMDVIDGKYRTKWLNAEWVNKPETEK